MTDNYVGEIRMFGGNFAPVGWALCNGQLLSIPQNTALFSILGVTYGGDGVTTFQLPNLQGRIPMQQGEGPGLSSRFLGESGGSTTVTLLNNQMPQHTHTASGATGPGSSTSPAGAVWATAHYGRRNDLTYSAAAPTVQMSALGAAGGNQPHNNMPPYLAVSFIIALSGDYPPRP